MATIRCIHHAFVDRCVPVVELRALLLTWWQEHGRHTIPWKLRSDGDLPEPGEALDPFAIWSAEVMLQQTQLQVVLPYWRRPRAFNQALMDLGATVCTPRHPSCGACPWQGHCAAYAAGDPAAYPVKDAPRELPFQVIGVGVVRNGAGAVLIDQRLNEGLLGGLWEFPGGKQEPGEAIEATIARELREELAIEVVVGEELIVVDHAYSHKKLRFVVHLCAWLAGEPKPLASQQVRWVRPDQLADFPFPAANARIIAALLARLQAEDSRPAA
jgi:A/G-specific adenine glycosylase